MNILHIASIKSDPFSGVSVVVPEHVRAQKSFADVSLLNVTNERIEGIEHQIKYRRGFSFESEKIDLAVFHEAYRLEYIFLSSELRKTA